ncbi:MAG: acyltransferase [Vicinamibacterales bacterium]
MAQLDGIRAIAVLFVMVFHFIPWVDRYAPLGSMGVRLFFVLSGFLITRILLDSRERPLGAALKTFYARRFLRIFPLFYFALFAAAAMNISVVRATLGWHLAYLSNVYFYLQGNWQGAVSHFWSLAVEEQFYLVWPWLILCLPRAAVVWVVAVMIPLAPLTRLVIDHPMISVLPTSCLDSLGLGALLAFQGSRRALATSCVLVGAPLLAGALWLRYSGAGAGYQDLSTEALAMVEIATDFGVSLVAVWLVGKAASGFGGLAGAILQWPPLVYLGTISYGVYVYHAFMPYLLGRWFGGAAQSLHWWSRSAILAAASIVVASVSWHLLERPILRLKRHFPA